MSLRKDGSGPARTTSREVTVIQVRNLEPHVIDDDENDEHPSTDDQILLVPEKKRALGVILVFSYVVSHHTDTPFCIFPLTLTLS
jgi:hypothetical protein